MSKSNRNEKPKLPKNGSIYWADNSFILEHATVQKEPNWFSKHPVRNSILLILLLTSFYVLSFFDELRIPAVIIMAVLSTLIAIFLYKIKIHKEKYYKDLFNRGGEIKNEKNIKLVNQSSSTLNHIAFVFTILMIFAYCGIIIYSKLNGKTGFNYYNYMIYHFPLMYSTIFSNSPPLLGPVIFMDLDEGVLFGGYMFSYEALTGIRPTNNNGGFELIHGGKKTAWGTMFPDDLNYLLEMIEIREKYSDYLKVE